MGATGATSPTCSAHVVSSSPLGWGNCQTYLAVAESSDRCNASRTCGRLGVSAVVRATVRRVLDRIDGGVDLGTEQAYEQAVLRAYPLPGGDEATAKRPRLKR
eukprot:COSAG01_NODE_6289_length_3752_cov_7.704900_3_plen_103_part_00